MYPRFASDDLAAALADTPAVLVVGPRQAGKSTLVRAVEVPRTYVTLDDAGPLSAARSDPAGFLAGLDGPVTIDEAQKAPELFPALKASIDRDRRPGRFLLTGSANVLLLPTIAESLAGRMEIITLLPLTQTEIALGAASGRRRRPTLRSFVDDLFGDAPLAVRASGRPEWVERALAGGFPEALARTSPARRRAWLGSYVATILARDARDVADIAGISSLPRLLSLLATRAGTVLNVAELSRSVDVPQTTLGRYLALLETLYLVARLPAWSANLGKRLVKAPKLLFVDSGLLAHLLGLTNAAAVEASPARGALLESFVAAELVRLANHSRVRPTAFHLRSHAGLEVDVVLEDARGRLVGIEVKASHTPSARDFAGLRGLEAAVGKRLHRGVLLHDGTETVPFGARLHAVPLRALFG